MRNDKSLVIKLRLQGKSYSEIQKMVGNISKSTLSSWLKNVILPVKTLKTISERTNKNALAALIRRNKNQTKIALENRNKIKNAAKREINRLSKRDIFVMGLALYWAEGYKLPIKRLGREVTFHPISLTNSDPALIKIFLRFMKEICGVGVDRIKANLRIFKHLNPEQTIRFWLRETGIPEGNFSKTYLGISRSSMGKRPFNRLPFGVIQVRISNTNLFHKIMGWIEGVRSFEF